ASIAEAHLGVNLEGTQIDGGRTGQRKAREESALAVTQGGQVSFAEGQLDSSTLTGRELLGHELVHVAQQKHHGAGSARQYAKPDETRPPNSATNDQKPIDVLSEELVSKVSEEQITLGLSRQGHALVLAEPLSDDAKQLRKNLVLLRSGLRKE